MGVSTMGRSPLSSWQATRRRTLLIERQRESVTFRAGCGPLRVVVRSSRKNGRSSTAGAGVEREQERAVGAKAAGSGLAGRAE